MTVVWGKRAPDRGRVEIIEAAGLPSLLPCRAVQPLQGPEEDSDAADPVGANPSGRRCILND